MISDLESYLNVIDLFIDLNLTQFLPIYNMILLLEGVLEGD